MFANGNSFGWNGDSAWNQGNTLDCSDTGKVNTEPFYAGKFQAGIQPGATD